GARVRPRRGAPDRPRDRRAAAAPALLVARATRRSRAPSFVVPSNPPEHDEREPSMQKRIQRITPFLWFDDQAEEAVNFYTSIFDDARILAVTRYGAESARVSGRKEGSVMTVAFQLAGQDFTALNGGPHFHFTEALSLVVHCASQAEVDHYWDR